MNHEDLKIINHIYISYSQNTNFLQLLTDVLLDLIIYYMDTDNGRLEVIILHKT